VFYVAASGLNVWRAVRMDTSLSTMMQQWRAARTRTHTHKSDVIYPPLVPARQQVARAREARQHRMLQMYQRHRTADPVTDEDAALDDMLEWCSKLSIADYFEYARNTASMFEPCSTSIHYRSLCWVNVCNHLYTIRT
jgi:hypothetical protein